MGTWLWGHEIDHRGTSPHVPTKATTAVMFICCFQGHQVPSQCVISRDLFSALGSGNDTIPILQLRENEMHESSSGFSVSKGPLKVKQHCSSVNSNLDVLSLLCFKARQWQRPLFSLSSIKGLRLYPDPQPSRKLDRWNPVIDTSTLKPKRGRRQYWVEWRH